MALCCRAGTRRSIWYGRQTTGFFVFKRLALNTPLSTSSEAPERTRYRKANVLADLGHFQIRTVFVVQAVVLHKFLNWADAVLTY